MSGECIHAARLREAGANVIGLAMTGLREVEENANALLGDGVTTPDDAYVYVRLPVGEVRRAFALFCAEPGKEPCNGD